MRRFRIALLVCMLTLAFSAQCFATTTLELEEKFSDAGERIDARLTSAKEDLLNVTYPVGSVYTTLEDLNESDVRNLLGGKWEQIKGKNNKGTFLWAKGSGDTVGATGGKQNYSFSAMFGKFTARGDTFISYMPGMHSLYAESVPNYVMNADTADLSSNEITFDGSVSVTEGGSPTINVMPPYTIVKMFRRIS